MSMSSKNAPAPDIMNVRELIEYAFGDFEENAVNFKLVQTVLFLIARQLRLLERRVEVELGTLHLLPSDTTLSVTEVKIHAMQKKKQSVKKKAKDGGVAGTKPGNAAAKPGEDRVKPGLVGAKLGAGGPMGKKLDLGFKGTSTDKSFTYKTSADKTTTDNTPEKTSSDKISTDKTSADKTSSTDKTMFTGKITTPDMTSSGKTPLTGEMIFTDETSSTVKTTSTGEKYSTDQTSSTVKSTLTADKSTTDQTSTTGKPTSTGEKTYTYQTSSTAKTTLTGDMSPTDQTSSTVKTTSTGEKTSIDQTSTALKTNSNDMISSGKMTSSGEKASNDKTSSTDQTKSHMTSSVKTTLAREETSTDEISSTTKSTTYKTSSRKTASAGEKAFSDEISPTIKPTFKTSSGKTTSSKGKTSTDKTTATDKSSSWKSSDRTSVDKSSSSIMTSSQHSKDVDKREKTCNYLDYLSTLEEQRERQLRVIHQREDSFEDEKKSPSPMASLSSIEEAHYEKLLVVKKVPSKEARGRESVYGAKRTPQISVVTQEQFEEVADAVRQLEKKLLPVGTPGFPEHAELMEELRRGASLTDAMAALQLSARLEATEKTLTQMISMVTELALQTPGVELDNDTQTYLGLPGGTGQKGFDAIGVFERSRAKSGKNTREKRDKGVSALSTIQPTKTIMKPETDEASESKTAAPDMQAKDTVSLTAGADQTGVIQYVTYHDLHAAATEIYEEIIKKVKTLTSRTSATADNAYKLSKKLEAKLDASVDVSSKMANLENAVKQYAEQINALDTGLSSQMTNYQEQLTQMQHDLEIGLDNMAEVFGNSGGDVEAMSELHSRFTSLQVDLEAMAFRQKELKVAQDSMTYDLENLWKEIEMLRDTKSDREEVTDALRDKAGISELNGLVSLQQFDAVRSDFEKRIAAAYDTFNNQEYVWQKAIDDMFKVLYQKADAAQVLSLKEEIQKYLNRMKERMQIISDIVGEPKSAIISKKVFRDSSCLACGSPAYMDMEEANKVPALPKFPSAKQPAEGAEAESQTKGGGDNRPCYSDLPIPHPRNSRSHICKRYCGGSHTVVTDALNRAPQSLVVQQAQKNFNTTPGTDGKLYMVEEETSKIPCLACNKMSMPTSAAMEPKPQKHTPIDSIDEIGDYSLTPAAHEISYS